MEHYAKSPVMPLSKAKFLHLTATPFRTKRKEYFGNFIQAVAYAPDISDLIEMGYLIRPRHYGYGGTSFDDIDKNSSGEFNQQEVIARTLDEDYNLDVANKIYNFARDRKVVLFCAGVSQAHLLAGFMMEKGFASEIVTAKTPQETRNEIYQNLREGKTNCLIGVNCFTEGFDVPSVNCIALARPTNSVALLIQMCGRGLRISEGKEDCLLLDFGGNFQRLGRIDQKRKAEICPVEPQDPPTKECPNCGAVLNTFVQVCPECGHEFEFGEVEEEPPAIPDQFGEILSEEEQKQVRYARTQRKMRFKKGQHPDGLFEKWDEKYYLKPLPQDWLYGAVFSKTTPDNEQRFLEYLQKFSTYPDWLHHHMSMEFTHPSNRKKYKVPKPLSWWQVFNVAPMASYEVVKDVYQKQIQSASDHEAKLLNWALSQAKKQCQF
jgi:superfamily II DNA or RNA helicase